MRTYAHIFYVDSFDSRPDQPQGWYFAFGCDPACLPESDPRGPFGDERLAIAEARAEMMEEGWEEIADLEWEVADPEVMFPVSAEGLDIDQQDEGYREFDANKLDCPFMD
jgi:hypothetical protein